MFRLLLSGDFVIHGFTNKRLCTHLPDKSSAQVSHLLKRLCIHGLLKKVQHAFRYYLTDFGRQAAAVALTLQHAVIVPALNQPVPS